MVYFRFFHLSFSSELFKPLRLETSINSELHKYNYNSSGQSNSHVCKFYRLDICMPLIAYRRCASSRVTPVVRASVAFPLANSFSVKSSVP